MRRILLITIMIAAAIILPVPALLQGGGGEYSSGIQFAVNTTGSVGTVTNYPIMVNLSNASGVSGPTIVYTNGTTRVDWKDINVTDANDAQLPFWVENNTYTVTGSTLWIKPASIGSTAASGAVVRIYYGNASKTTFPAGFDGMATFSLFDDFLGSSLNTTKWKLGSGTGISGGYATVTGTTTTGYYYQSNAVYGVNYSARSRFNVSSNTNYVDVGFYNFSSVTIRADYSYQSGQVVLAGDGTIATTALTADPTTMGVMDVHRNNTASVIARWNGGTASAVTTHVPSTNLPFNVYPAPASGSKTAFTDWVFVRPYQYPEPTMSAFSQIPDQGVIPPSASFASSSSPGYTTENVTFTDTSTGGTVNTSCWQIEGTWYNGSALSISHRFSTAGLYNITHWVNNTAGGSSATQDQDIIEMTILTAQDMINSWVVILSGE